MPIRPVGIAGLVAGLVLAGCASDPAAAPEPSAPTSGATPTADPGASSPSASTPPPEPSAGPSRRTGPRRGTAITTGPSNYGTMLFDGTGQAIYLFDKETAGAPLCSGPCAAAWPPVLTRGEPRPAGATRARLLGTVERPDGSTQVTYAGHPLYFYAHEGTGQVLCHDVVEFGGVWLVVTPRGTPAA